MQHNYRSCYLVTIDIDGDNCSVSDIDENETKKQASSTLSIVNIFKDYKCKF